MPYITVRFAYIFLHFITINAANNIDLQVVLDDKFINMIFKFLQRPPTLTGLNTSISKS